MNDEIETGQMIQAISLELGDVVTLVSTLLEVKGLDSKDRKLDKQVRESLELAVETYQLVLRVRIAELKKLLPKKAPNVVSLDGGKK